MNTESIVAVDLGTNSFRLQIADIVDQRLVLKESLKETVQLGAGLDDNKMLDEKTQKRALATLSRFADRMRGYSANRVRIVGTNALRVAKNAGAFLYEAEKVLGYPIDVISGFEEARLIYNGAAHALPSSKDSRFVVDIGGGSTEIMVGQGFELQLSSSLHMGCVSFSREFFPKGKITKQGFLDAELKARCELLPMVDAFSKHGWAEAVGCSGTIKALCELSHFLGHTESLGVCVRETLVEMKALLIKAGNVFDLDIDLISSDRARVLAGGLSILLAVFDVFNLEKIDYSDGALLQGVFYDQVGRIDDKDFRDQTVNQMVKHYHVDIRQADRVTALALSFYESLSEMIGIDQDKDHSLHCQMLRWACRLHEIGKSISISGYHRHSAYILRYADMSGFSKQNQAYLALLVFSQRGKMHHVLNQTILPKTLSVTDCALIICLRLAVLFLRSRRDLNVDVAWVKSGNRYQLVMKDTWLFQNPLIDSMLTNEFNQWKQMPLAVTLVREGTNG